jgi:predicted transposase YbfD/YdcC
VFEFEPKEAEAVMLSKGHGRLERREVRTSEALVGYSDFPGLAQAVQIKKRVVFLKAGEIKNSVHYLVTSLPAACANPGQLAAHCRNHWGIENRLFHVKDDTFGEDRHVMGSHRSGSVMSLFRATAITLLRGRSVLWNDKDPLTARAQAVNTRPLEVFG